ncbi:MAG: uridine kinase [Ktedonobacterales bacterium]
MRRAEMLERLVERITTQPADRPVRVAIDGVDASGKTTLANELTPPLLARGRTVIRASIDGFHRPRAQRYRRGPDSPEGYYRDSFDHAALRQALLLPLGSGGSRRYRRAAYDYRADRPLLLEEEVAPENAILLFDGVFLLRPELNDQWDYRVYVDAPFTVTLARATRRDLALFGSLEEVVARYERRYIPGQRLYLQEALPRERADVVVKNADPEDARLAVRGDSAI